ncbi:MAG TPA: NAD(P)-dependent oxidoreductase, partial [Chryseosolibacter sp.]|nr:NAD(P)-dependent oxidoreductase [Chryseosolibacter sp.]
MADRKCLIVDSMHPSLFPLLGDIGWQGDYEPEITPDQIKDRIGNYQGLIVRSKTIVNQSLLGDRPSIRFVARAGAGVDNLDLEFLSSRNISVVHAAEGNRDAVGEFTVGLLISLLRNIPKSNAEVSRFTWDREGNRGTEVMGKTIGLIGYGNMGRAFASRIAAFGCKVLAYDKYKSRFADNFCREATMEQIYAEADILSLHIPLSAETRMMVNADYLNRFAKNIVLLNTARGEIVRL